MSKERETYIQPQHQSSIDMCLRCRRSYMFKYRWCIFPRRPAFSIALSQGKITHRLLDLGPGGVEIVRAEVASVIDELIERIDRGEDLLGQIATQVNNLTATFDKALAMVTILWERYPRPEHHKVLAKEKTIRATFRLSPSDEPALVTEIGGTLDEMVEDTKTGLVWIRDYKTSGRDVAFTMTGYQYSLQCRLYRLLGGAYLQSLEGYENRAPEGFILEVLQTPAISMCDKDRDYTEVEHTLTRGPRKGEIEIRREYEGEPKFENYIKRCREWYAEKGDEAVQSFSIRFNESVLPPELRSDLLIGAIHQVFPAEPKYFPRDETTSYCKHYERICPYYELCSRDEASWDAIIEERFEVVPPEEEEDKADKDLERELEDGKEE